MKRILSLSLLLSTAVQLHSASGFLGAMGFSSASAAEESSTDGEPTSPLNKTDLQAAIQAGIASGIQGGMQAVFTLQQDPSRSARRTRSVSADAPEATPLTEAQVEQNAIVHLDQALSEISTLVRARKSKSVTKMRNTPLKRSPVTELIIQAAEGVALPTLQAGLEASVGKEVAAQIMAKLPNVLEEAKQLYTSPEARAKILGCLTNCVKASIETAQNEAKIQALALVQQQLAGITAGAVAPTSANTLAVPTAAEAAATLATLATRAPRADTKPLTKKEQAAAAAASLAAQSAANQRVAEAQKAAATAAAELEAAKASAAAAQQAAQAAQDREKSAAAKLAELQAAQSSAAAAQKQREQDAAAAKAAATASILAEVPAASTEATPEEKAEQSAVPAVTPV